MSTRAQIRFATREVGVSFNEHPNAIHAQFYKHSDGYPEGLGVDIAESLLDSTKIERWEIEHLDTRHGDLEYIYYIWQAPLKTTWISIFEGMGNGLDFECIFVGEPVTNKQILDKINDLKVGEEGLNLLAIKIVSRMVKLKSMEDWFHHVSKSDIAWSTSYKDLELTEEENALGEAAKLMTLMNLFQEDEAYEKCAIIKQRMDEVNRILKKGNK
jgi:hypothetical protein